MPLSENKNLLSLNSALSYLGAFIDLLFPRVCPLCGNVLLENEKKICSHCLMHLPETRFINLQDNPVARVFWGRVPFVAATSFLYFEKGNMAQKLIHSIKYHNNKELGYEMGKYFGVWLNKYSEISDVDIVFPVPLHKRKLKIRGFNQSEWIGRGIAESIGKPLEEKNLFRSVYNPTQTKKSRYARWKNVEGIFALHNPEKLSGKHILLIDDVITTGSTIEACANAILHSTDVEISIASIAFAH